MARLGSAYVAIEADGSLFRASAYAAMKRGLAGLKAEIPVTAATKRASTQIRRVLEEIAHSDPTIDVNFNSKMAQQVLGNLRSRVLQLADDLDEMRANPDLTKDALYGISSMQLAVKRATQELLKMKVSPQSIQKAENIVLGLESSVGRLRSGFEKTEEAIKDANSRASFFTSITPRINDLANRLAGLKIDVKDKDFLAKIARMEARLAAFRDKKVEISPAGFAKAIAELAALEAGTDAMAASVGRLNDRLTRGRVAWFGWIGGLLNAKVALFAGAREVSGWHLALDSIVETLAILIPSLVVLTAGLGAFAAAAFLAQDTAMRVADHLKYVNTVAEATGQIIPPMTDHFNQLAKSIRPQVFQLYGAGIESMNRSQGLFNTLATKTGDLLDTFAARIIVDMRQGGTGIATFVRTGQQDLKELGELFQSLGHIIAQVGRVAAETGIAEKLLGIATAVSKVTLGVLNLPVPLLAAVVGLHGIYLWGGLATTALVKLGLGPLRGLANIAAGSERAGRAVKGLEKDAGALKRIQAYAKDIGHGFGQLPNHLADIGKALLKLGANPWAVFAAGIAAIVLLTLWTGRAKDATDQFIDSQKRLIGNATLLNVINVTASALVNTNQRLAKTQRDVTAEMSRNNFALREQAGRTSVANQQFAEQVAGIRKLQDAHSLFTGQIGLEATRLSFLADKFNTKGLAGAEALAYLAGVKVSGLLSRDQKVWDTAAQKVQDLVTGYANMGQGANQLGADMNALTVAGSNQIKAIGQLNDAFDAFTKIVSGPTTTFISFAESIVRFGEDAQKAGAKMTGLGGEIINTSKKVRSSSLQLQQDFQDTFNSAEQLFDAMRSSEEPANKQVAAIKLAVQVLIPLAGKNKAAAAEISALAQEAGGPATTNLRQLAKWAGHVKDPLGALQHAAQDATVSFSNLSLDAQKLGTTLAQDLVGDMAKAVENAVGLQGAMNKVALDIQHGTENTAAGHKDRKQLYDDLVQITGSGAQADAIIAGITDRLHRNADTLRGTDKVRKAYQEDINKILERVPNAKSDIDKYTDAVRNQTDKTDAGKSARQKLIDDLRKTGLNAKDAKGLVDDLQTDINKLRGKQVGVGVFVTADGKITVTASAPANVRSQISINAPKLRAMARQGLAAGGRVPGWAPGMDSIPAMLSPGEFVLTPEAAAGMGYGRLDAYNRKMSAGRQTRQSFASGGLAVAAVNSGIMNTIDKTAGATGTGVQQDTTVAMARIVKYVQDAVRKAAAAQAAAAAAAAAGVPGALGGPTSASAAQAQAYARSRLGAYGWGQDQMPSLIALWNGESGWNRLARNPSSGAYGIPQALPGSKMGAAANPPTSSAAAQINWGLSYIRSIYTTPSHAYSLWLGRSPHWYAQGGPVQYLMGGEVPPMVIPHYYASGGTVAQQGQRYLTAWRTRHGGGYGAAWGPIVVNEQIARMAAAFGRATTLSHARGLSAGQHKFWANAASDEHRRLEVLTRERKIERDWRGQLVAEDVKLGKQIKAAGNLPSLRGAVRNWKSQVAAHEGKIGQISKMLGYTDAYLKAHPAAPKLPPVKHVYGGDVGDVIAPILAAAMAPFAAGGRVKSYDNGGWLMPGATLALNNTGRPEPVGGPVQVDVKIELGESFRRIGLTPEQARDIKYYVKVNGAGNAQRAFGTH